MGDIMYYAQALQQPDAKQFTNAVVKEVNGHIHNKHWTLVKQKDVPKEAQVVPSVWAMQRKRDLTTNKIIKHKARLNLHGEKTNVWDELLRNICTCYHPVCHQARDSFWHHFLLGSLAS